jgi:capsid protein
VQKGTGVILGYEVHDRDEFGGFGGQHAERFVPASQIIPVINAPWRPDQVREVPDFASITNLLQDIMEMNLYTLATAKEQSKKIAFLQKNQGATGSPGPRGNSVTSTPGQSRQSLQTSWGEIYEGFVGEQMNLLASPTPGVQHIPYMQYNYGQVAASLGFPYEFFTLDLSSLDFSRQKGMLLLVNHACRPWRQWISDDMMKPLWNWSVGLAMARGLIPLAPVNDKGVSEWSQVEWQAPEELWIDRQEAMQADIMEIQAGFLTYSRASKRRGNDFESDLRAKARDLQMIKKIAAEYDVDPEELSKIQIPGQTPPAPEPEKETPEPEDDDSPEDTKEGPKDE